MLMLKRYNKPTPSDVEFVTSVSRGDLGPTTQEVKEFMEEYDEWELNRFLPFTVLD